jgi:hypothetical protein
MSFKKYAYIACAFLMFSCGNEEGEEKVGADIINNPASASGEDKEKKRPAITFENLRHEFGEIQAGSSVTEVFNFENTGEADLVIYKVHTSCGCTVAEDWPRDPIKPGEKGSFSVVFNSTGKSGQQVKKVKIEANTYPSLNVVAIAGYVNTGKK